jgi:hypothetical protein
MSGYEQARGRGRDGLIRELAEFRLINDLARLMLSKWHERGPLLLGRSTMTNFQSCAGGIVWMTIAALLMLATFEPVAVAQPSDAGTPRAVAPHSAV